METARARILQFIDNQGIKPSEFVQKTELKKGIIDKSHINSGTTEIILSKILDVYPILSPEWLLTGKGEMLRSGTPVKSINIDKPEKSMVHEDEQEYTRKGRENKSSEMVDYLKERIVELEKMLREPDPSFELVLRQLSEKDQEIGRLRGKFGG